MKKRILSILLVLAMMLSMLPVIASAETETPEIKSAQLVLNSVLSLNITVDLKGNDPAEYTMDVTIGESATQSITSTGNVYTAKVMAHQMLDTIQISLKQGDAVVASVQNWTIKTYVDAINDDVTVSDEVKTLATAMYQYGQYAAYYKNGGEDPAIDTVTNTTVDKANKLELRKTSAGLGAVAYLYLDEACDLGFKFNAAAMEGLTLYVDYNAVEATAVSDTQVGYKIPEILPQNYDVKHTIQVKSGEELVFDLSYSVLSYVYTWQNKSSSQYASLIGLLKSMQVYGTAAEVYIDTLPTYLTAENAGTPELFAATINAAPDKEYILTEDLDWTGEAGSGVAAFSGVLDGQGHSIKGLVLGMIGAANSWHSTLIHTNEGTIKNLAIDYSLNELSGDNYSLIIENKGTLENLFVKAAFAAASSHSTAAIVDTNYGTGTIQNCIVDVSSTAANNSQYIGPVAYLDYNGTITNCYIVNTANDVTTPYTDGWKNGAYTNSAVYASNQTLLDAVEDLSAADGWSSYWAITEGGITFNGEIVVAGTVEPPCDHTDSYPYDGICDECKEAFEPTGYYLINSSTAPSAKEFAGLIHKDLAGTYYVTEDLDYTENGVIGTGIGDFTGVLDGQGHMVKGLDIKYNANDGYIGDLFKSNSGTIENIAFEYSIPMNGNGEYNGLIGTNYKTIQNVYAKATLTQYNNGKRSGALVGINSGADAVVKNCIVDVTLDDSITVDEYFAAVVSLNGSTATLNNCYYTYTAAEGITVPGVHLDNSTVASVKVLDENATVNFADGWSDCWKTDDTGLYFGSTLILAAAAKCDHEDASPVDGICDLCNETVPLPENTYLINSTSAATKAALVELINADLDGHYYLTEDLTYTAESNTGIGDFAGVLDGQGHSISGIQFKYGMINGIYDTFLFKSNTGTIQNIALEYTILLANSEYFGLVAHNSGIIQNVYAKATMKAMKTNGYGSAFVGEQVKDSTAAIKNCIVDVTIDSSITNVGEMFGAIVGCNQAGTTVQNCYYTYTAVESITVPAITDGTVNWGTVTNVKALDENATVRTADEWGSCWKMALDGIWFGNMHVLDIQVAEEAIAVYSSYSASNVSDDTIAGKGSTEDDRANIFAWYDFQKLYQEITGEAIEVVFVNSVSDLDDDRTYFILGDDLAATASLTTDDITTDNGHKIVKSGDDIYLYGKSGYGTANAMYAFLKQAFGAEFYSDTVYTTTGSTYSIDSISDATFNPAVDYNWAYDGLLYSNNGTDINYAYQMRMGFVNYWQIQGGSFHAFSELFADSDYSVDVDLNAGGTIGTSSTYVQAVADYVYAKATSGTGKSVIAVGPADTHTWSDSSASQANLSTYGANSGEYLLFMNAVMELLNTDSKYADIPAVEVVMLVYNGSLAAPTNYSSILPNQHTERGVTLKAMFAPAEMNINVAPTDSSTKDYYDRTPSYYYGEYAKWQTIFGADNVYFWRYSTIFNEYLTPVNTVEYIQENYQALVGSDNYIKHMMDQGTGLSPVQTNYQALLVYLKGQLGKDPNADLDTLITNFCNAYYGTEAGSYIKQLLEAEQSHLNTLREKMLISDGYHYARDLSGCISMPIPSSIFSQYYNLHDAKWWSANCSDDDGAMLKTWYGYITSALAATSDAEQQARIQVEAIALRYISLKAHGVALVSGDSLAQVEADAIALGITRYSEGKAIDSLA